MPDWEKPLLTPTNLAIKTVVVEQFGCNFPGGTAHGSSNRAAKPTALAPTHAKLSRLEQTGVLFNKSLALDQGDELVKFITADESASGIMRRSICGQVVRIGNKTFLGRGAGPKTIELIVFACGPKFAFRLIFALPRF